jgi:hypothetical protein
LASFGDSASANGSEFISLPIKTHGRFLSPRKSNDEVSSVLIALLERRTERTLTRESFAGNVVVLHSSVTRITQVKTDPVWEVYGVCTGMIAYVCRSCLGCADFVPSNLDPGSQFAVPMFECFEEVLRKASSWVRHQHRVRITNVQSIDYKLKHDYGESTSTCRLCF